MRALSLEELHSRSLEILKDVDRFCRRNGIRYSMSYGTLLGAVRHKGFIPWDDDIDLVMPREDYIRFTQTYKSDRFEFLCRENCEDVWIAFGRVVDRKQTRLVSTSPWHDPRINTGVWLDIFPLDYVPDDYEGYESLYRCFNHLLALGRRCRGVHAAIEAAMPLKYKLKVFFHSHLHPRLKQIDPSVFAKDYITALQLAVPRKSAHMAQLGCADADRLFEASWFDEYVELPFEGALFMAPARWDEVLRAEFGKDYMSLPPKEKQVTDLYRIANVYALD